MELNSFTIESRRMLKENFLPFQKIWENVENGLYQECIHTFFGADSLTAEILSAAEWLLNGNAETLPEKRFWKEYQNFMEGNREQTKALEDAAGNEKQKSTLYLCVLMHIHAEHSRLAPETGEFIHKLLGDKEIVVAEADSSGEPDIYRQQSGIVNGEAYCLDENGRIVSQRNGSPLSIAKDMRGLCSFAYTDMLGLIAVSRDGQVHVREGLTFVEAPSGRKIVSVSACLSSYMLLDENGAVYTNIDMDLSEWTDLRYIYVGLNSAAGVKRWSGNVVTVGAGEVPAFANVARMYTYHGRERHYIALLANGETRDDEGEVRRNITAVALDGDGYYYAGENGKVYKRCYGEEKIGEEELCMEEKGRVRELLVEQGKIFMFS